MLGPVEVDETYVGGRDRARHASKRLGRRWKEGRTVVVAVKDRETKRVAAQVIDDVDSETLGEFVDEHASKDAMVYTDGSSAYRGRKNHESVAHSVGEYVRGQVHTNGVESFWAMLKRGYTGVYHRLSPKHLQSYVNEFAGRHNIREYDTIRQMQHVVLGMVGQRLMYRQLTAPTDRSAEAG